MPAARCLLPTVISACLVFGHAAAAGSGGNQIAMDPDALSRADRGLPELAQAQAPPGSPEAATPDTLPSKSAAATSEQHTASFWQRDSLTGDWGGLRTTLQNAGIKFGLLEQSEVWANVVGGLRRGVVYDGLTTGSITLDLDKLAGWSGATFFV